MVWATVKISATKNREQLKILPEFTNEDQVTNIRFDIGILGQKNLTNH